jgi:preprotein translocase subunit SecD
VTFLSQDGGTKYKLSKVLVPGDAIAKATAVFDTQTSQWQISFQMTSAGSKTESDVTTNLVSQAAPENQLAIVLDQKVISSPTVQQAITNGTGQITGSFTEQRAKDLATVLNAGALPVQLTKSQIQTVSPTLGKESLHEGLIAGIVGLIALALYLLFYYRLLGIVTWFGMGIWAILTIGLISILGRTVGYSLSLAGIAGVIVSMGITADSYIVFYERLKDEVRHGKTPRSAIVPAFQHAWHTIVAADIVTILAAAVLYLLTIGSVRGFALTLGLATLLDMFVVYFFKRPTVFLIARSERLTNLKGMGLTSGVAADPVPVPAMAGGSK